MNVEELLSSKSIKYTMKGGDYVVRCQNPEHPDHNPSMRIDRITGIFGCFSCGFKGNIFTLFGGRVNQLQIRRDLLKSKIRKKRAESVGLSLPTGFLPYAGNWRDIKPETYKKFEAFQHHDTDYVGRVIFPIKDISGRIAAFNGRHMTGGVPKYLISPRGAKLPLFPQVKPIKGSVILVEGIFDMLNLHDKGLDNAVCCFGTKNINEDKLSMLRISGADQIDIFMDGDDAGKNAADSIIAMCDEIEMAHRNIYLKGTDPGALTENQVLKLKDKLYG